MNSLINRLAILWTLIALVTGFSSAQQTTQPATQPLGTAGLVMRLYKLPKVPRTFPTPLPGQQPDYVSIVPTVDITSGKPLNGIDSNFQAQFTGQLHIASAGKYEFSLEADFAAELSLDGKLLLSDQWTPDRAGPTTHAITLQPGVHSIQIRFIQDDGGLRCTLMWTPPNHASLPAFTPASNRLKCIYRPFQA